MPHRSTPPAALCALLLAATGSAADDVTTPLVDTFENGENAGGWTYAFFDQPMELTPEGGNPGWMLRADLCCDSFPPYAHTIGSSAFTGDFRARNVTRLSVDVRVFNLEIGSPFTGAPLSLRLQSDNGTPGDPADDFAAYFAGGPEHATPLPEPEPSGEWRTIAFDVPAQDEGLPPGWVLIPDERIIPEALPAGASWYDLMGSVSQVSFEHGPAFPVWPDHVILWWDFAVDNVTITADGLGADVNGDGVVNVDDLVAVITGWGPCGDVCPDANGDGVVDVSDLVLVILGWS